MNIKKKLTISLILASLIPFIIFNVINLKYSIQSAKENAMSDNLQRTETIEANIGKFIDKNLYGLRGIASNPLLGTDNVADVKPILINAGKVYTDMVFAASDANGQQFARSNDEPLSEISDRKYYQQAMTGQDEVVSEVLISRATNKPITILATPRHDPTTGKSVGALQGSVNLDILSELVKKFSSDNTTVYILDCDGHLLAHPTKDLAKAQDNDEFSKLDFVKKALSRQNGSDMVTIDGTEMLVSYTQNAKSGWVVCSQIPYKAAIAESVNNTIFISILGCIIILLTGGCAFWIAGIATKPLHTFVEAAKSIARGNLSIKPIDLKSKDELGVLASAFNEMVKKLTQFILQVQSDAETVAAASEQLTASADQSAQASNQVAESITGVASSAEKQRRVVESTAKIVSQMSKSIGLANQRVQTVADQSNQSTMTARQGGETIQKAVTQMSELETTVDASAKVVMQLGERSQTIGEIVNTISGIAGQTNLLALNAAIEAARAGEQGRGFSVVAEEVRKLAEQSQTAASQIAELIQDIQTETTNAVQAMDRGTAKTQQVTEVVNHAGQAFQEIVDHVSGLSLQVQDITGAVQELDQGSQQIVTAVREIETLTHGMTDESQNVSAATEEQAASIHEIATSSQALAKMAADLQTGVSKFQTQ